MAETLYPISTSGYSSAGIGWSTSTSTIIQGSTSVYSNYYGVLYFNFAAIRAMNVTHRAINIRLRLKSHVGYARTVRVYMGCGMDKDTFSYGARPSAADGTAYKEISCAANGWCEIDTSDSAWLAAIINAATTCFYINRGDSDASYWEGDGAKHANKPELYIDWTPRDPLLSVPLLDPIATITTETKTFQWSNSSDSNGAVTSGDISYSMQISTDGGAAWGTAHTTAAGVSEHAENLKTYIGLSAAQYYHNSAMRIRAKAYCSYLGSTYESAYATSSTFTVDYRVVPSAPLSLSVDNAVPYEGQSVAFTVGRPANYNTLDGTGAVEGIKYYVQLADGTALKDVDTDVSFATKSTAAYTVGNLTSGISNRTTTLRTYAVTHKSGNSALETQAGPFLSLTQPMFMIQRFRAPSVVVTGVQRSTTTDPGDSAIVDIGVTDTGYGMQNSTQINAVRYSLNGGVSYTAASLGAWSASLTNSFTIAGSLDPAMRYPLAVNVTNNAPAGAGLDSKTSADYSATIYEYTPVWATMKNPSATGNQAPKHVFTRALVVGEDVNTMVDKGSVVVERDLMLGGSIYMGGVARTASGSDAKLITGSSGIAGNLAVWNADGDVVDSSVSTGAWSTWVPTLTGITKGTYGTIIAKHFSFGKLVFFRFVFIFGSDSAITGNVRFSWPLTPSDIVGYRNVFIAEILDTGSTVYRATAFSVGTAGIEVRAANASGTYLTDYVQITEIVPMTWATGDTITVMGFYEAV